jgi:hypothetical protein
MSHSPRGILTRAIDWLRVGYPHGIPRHDYVALVGILHHRLTDEEVAEVAATLAGEADPVTEDDVREAVRAKVLEEASEEDIARVAELLASSGIDLSDELGESVPNAPVASASPGDIGQDGASTA